MSRHHGSGSQKSRHTRIARVPGESSSARQPGPNQKSGSLPKIWPKAPQSIGHQAWRRICSSVASCMCS
jgi:hypothetical protein